MKKTLALFTSKPLVEASGALLKKMGLGYSPMFRHGEYDDFFEINDFSYGYLAEAKKCVNHIWEIGQIDDSSLQGDEASHNDRYESMIVFACEINPNVKFSRPAAVALTRAFNRVFSTDISNIDIPIVVFMQQGDYLSIATCERTYRNDDNGEKIGKVTMLRNINCKNPHPGHRQILERIANDISGSTTYSELYSRWLKSFSIDVISDKFFKEYKSIYEDIVEFSTGKRMIKKDNKWVEHDNHQPCLSIMNEFSKFSDPDKAVRDYVKKLMGRVVFLYFLQKKGWMGVPAGDTWKGGDEDFLLNLFNRSNKKETFIDDVLSPLFHDINTDRQGTGFLVTNPSIGTNIKVPYLNGGLFEEDEYDKVKFPLGSDLIGRMIYFFSSYNFTIDENAPDDVEIGVDPEMLGKIFENLLEDNKDKGTFYTPKEIVQYMCQEALITHLTHKTGIQESDIRSFVLTPDTFVNKFNEDEKYNLLDAILTVKICDPAIGSGAFPIGLLNELVRCKEAIYGDKKGRADIKKEIIRDNIYGVDIEKGAVDIARLRFWLSLIVDEDQPVPLPNLDFKIMQGNSLMECYGGVDLSQLTVPNGADLTLNGKQATQLKGTLSRLLKQYFGENVHSSKITTKKSINKTISDLFEIAGIVIPGDVDVSENNHFFLWHTWYNEVFVNNGGFDICIGNPPYGASLSKEEKSIYRKLYPETQFKIDTYSLFVLLSFNLVKRGGVLYYILPNTLLDNYYEDKVREKLLISASLREVCDLSDSVFESAVVHSMILGVIHESAHDYPVIIKTDSINAPASYIPASYFIAQDQYCISYRNYNHQDLLNKLATDSTDLQSVLDIRQTIKTGNDRLYITSTKEADNFKPILRGKDIRKYGYRDPGLFLNYGKHLANPIRKDIFEQPKILIREAGATIVATYDDANYYIMSSLYNAILKDNSYDLLYLLALINSKVFQFLMNKITLEKTKGAFTKARIFHYYHLPVKRISLEEQKMFVNKVKEMMQRVKDDYSADLSNEEKELNNMIYSLYGLSPDEVAVIEGANGE